MPNWKKVLVSGSDAVLNSLYVTASLNVSQSFTASGLNYPTVDNGIKSFMQTDGAGNLSLQYVNTMYEQVKNGESTTILTGTPLYVSGAIGANQVVYRADASDPTKMPVVYIAGEDIAPNDAGLGIILGLIEGVTTTGYSAGTEIFVAGGGGWTSTRPTGSAIVQSLGIVSREGAGTSGKGIVLNPGPNNIPNIQSGYLWVGDSNSYPTSIATSSIQNVISSSYAATASSADNFIIRNNLTASNASFTGSVRITGSLALTGSLTIGSGFFDYNQNASINTGSLQVAASEATASYRAAFFDYVAFSGSISRAGSVYTVWSGSATEWFENYTADIGGSTSGIILQTGISGGNIQLQATASSAAWTIRSLVRML